MGSFCLALKMPGPMSSDLFRPVDTTACPSVSRRAWMRSVWTVLPAASGPSTTIKRPLDSPFSKPGRPSP